MEDLIHLGAYLLVVILVFAYSSMRTAISNLRSESLILRDRVAVLRIENASMDRAMRDMVTALTLIDKRVQRTLADPIMALDHEGRLCIYDGPVTQVPSGEDGDEPAK